MRLLFTLLALAFASLHEYDRATIFALLALAWALPGRDVVRRWLGWDEAIERASRDD